MSILWWHWLVLGLVLIIAEMTGSGGFYLVFFGIGGLIVGTLAALGLAGPVWAQVLLFSLTSIALLALFRNPVLRRFQRDPHRPKVDPIVGEIATAIDDITAGNVGRVELRGTPWQARNPTPNAVIRGDRCRVTRVEGLTVHIEPEGAR